IRVVRASAMDAPASTPAARRPATPTRNILRRPNSAMSANRAPRSMSIILLLPLVGASALEARLAGSAVGRAVNLRSHLDRSEGTCTPKKSLCRLLLFSQLLTRFTHKASSLTPNLQKYYTKL